MEYIDGLTLYQHLNNLHDAGKHMKEEKVCLYFEEIAKGIKHCHSLNIVHRDIKPDIIMITKSN